MAGLRTPPLLGPAMAIPTVRARPMASALAAGAAFAITIRTTTNTSGAVPSDSNYTALA